MEKKKIISALIGLVGACNNNPKTENTDQVVIKALALPLLQPEAELSVLQEMIGEIHAEKYAIAPGCAICQTPCGNTSDYDMGRIDNAEPGIRNGKYEILSALQGLAAEIYRRQEKDSLPPECTEVFSDPWPMSALIWKKGICLHSGRKHKRQSKRSGGK